MRVPGMTRQRGLTALAVLTVLGSAVVGCRKDAPGDVIEQVKSTDALVFVKTFGEETLNRSWSEGNLYKLSPISPEGKVTPITNFVGASISDPCVSFDGKKILFSMRPPGGRDRNIYEIHADGTGMRQVTSGGGHDFDPLYLPDGKIMFTSSRAGEMDEYNHSPAEHLYTVQSDGTALERVSFNQSDDFDPALMPDGRIVYTRWEHFGTFNRFPLFATNPDGTGTFHHFGPHGQNFFHAQPTPDGRLVAIASNRINEDAGPLTFLKPEQGPADPGVNTGYQHWDVMTTEVNTTGAPWAYGAFKYPFPIGDRRFVTSYTLPAATEGEVDYGLYTFSVSQTGEGTLEDPATMQIENLTFLYNDPEMNEYDAQLLAPREKPPVVPSVVDYSKDFGVFMAQDIFNRGLRDGQEVPVRGQDLIDKIAVFAARPTRRGEMNNFSANEFEKRALLGFAPVQADGSFKIKVPADTPLSFATLDDLDRGFVVKRTWLYVRPGETFDKCVGCHEDRGPGGPKVTNPAPMAVASPASDLNLSPQDFVVINFEKDIQPIVENKCVTCHEPKILFGDTDPEIPTPENLKAWVDTIPPAGNLDLRLIPDESGMGMGDENFPIGYINLSGEPTEGTPSVVTPAFPRRSKLVDYVLGVGSREGIGPHPEVESPRHKLTDHEKYLINMWVLLGAQFK